LLFHFGVSKDIVVCIFNFVCVPPPSHPSLLKHTTHIRWKHTELWVALCFCGCETRDSHSKALVS